MINRRTQLIHAETHKPPSIQLPDCMKYIWAGIKAMSIAITRIDEAFLVPSNRTPTPNMISITPLAIFIVLGYLNNQE